MIQYKRKVGCGKDQRSDIKESVAGINTCTVNQTIIVLEFMILSAHGDGKEYHDTVSTDP